jgi:hypothetical protein
MAFLDKALTFSLDAASDIVGNAGSDLSAITTQLKAYGLYTNGMEAAISKDPELVDKT